MVTQSRHRPVPILLTRPAAQGATFAKAVQLRFGDRVLILTSPLMAPQFLVPSLPEGPFTALILTSQTGVDGLALMENAATGLPQEVYCVGEKTAASARASGLIPVAVAPDAASLVDRVTALAPQGRLLHLRGQDAHGDVARNLCLAGVDTSESIVYHQQAQGLTSDAVAVLQDQHPVIVPLFSPRTATIFMTELTRIGGVAPLAVAAISGQVALVADLAAFRMKVAASPDAEAMLIAIEALLTELQGA